MSLLNKHIFLFLSLLALILADVFYSVLEHGAISASDEQYLHTTQQRLRQEMSINEEELQNVSNFLQAEKQPAFSDYKYSTKYPYFVFRNRLLQYWSDYRFVPSYQSLKSVIYPKMISFPQGDFIVNRSFIRQGADSLEIFSLVNVYRRYENENNYLRSGYNTDIFSLDPQRISPERGTIYQNMYDNRPLFLFSVIPPKIDVYQNHNSPVDTVILVTLSVFFMGLYLSRRTLILRQKRHYLGAFLVMALYLVVLRAVMLYFGVPFLFLEGDLFNPKSYASSVVAPSLGDLLLNCILVALLTFYLVITYYRTRSYYWLLRQADWVKAGASVMVIVLSYGVFYSCLLELSSIYEKSRFTLDITLSIRFSSLKIACLGVFISVSTIYFLLLHIFANLFVRLNASALRGLFWFGLSTALVGSVIWQTRPDLLWILPLHSIYLLILYIGRFPRSLYTFRYKTSIYLFLAALVCAVMSTYVVYKQGVRKDIVNKHEFADRLLSENDEFGEFLLHKLQGAIRHDTEIQRLMSDTLMVRERIQERVKALHWNTYFNRYEAEVLPFNAEGKPLGHQPQLPYFYYVNQYRQDRFMTQYPGLYFYHAPDTSAVHKYIEFLPIRSKDKLLGHIILNLKLHDERPKTAYSDLLTDKKLLQAPETRAYSYAIYDPQKKLLYSRGDYNYERQLPTAVFGRSALYDEGVLLNGYKHVGWQDAGNRIVIVSSKDDSLHMVLSNFSFLFLILILYALLQILVYAIRYGLSRFQVNYSTKTQLYLNVAFFLPLLLVVLITFGVISSNYATSQETAYLASIKNITANFLPYWEDHLQGSASKEYLGQELQKIARDADIDISLFTIDGRLYSSTQPLTYESGHLSNLINPEVYIHLIQDKENRILLTESLGNKTYRTAYAALKSFDGQLLGVLGVPHYDSETELDQQLIDVISTALNVFAGLFLVLLLVSYWASTLLTKPLKLVTQKIRRTNLDQFNEPLEWKSDDEIGVLIGEYNRMLIKLEEKKQALSQSEKQSAWREMAKQVAHEIKNPLTPMKLTLQHLQRTLPEQSDRLRRTLETLIDQIDNLSDIATSFSDFAKMPLPKNELFEITSVVSKAADLYADDDNITLDREIVAQPIMVNGDRQLIGRILTNLIINGVQSVPATRRPHINLQLTAMNETITIKISDNGAGVPEAIRGKIFLPNFSTKQGGSGLGLAIAKRGIEHAGGAIWFETETGEGTTFYITLPYVQGASEEESSLSPNPYRQRVPSPI